MQLSTCRNFVGRQNAFLKQQLNLARFQAVGISGRHVGRLFKILRKKRRDIEIKGSSEGLGRGRRRWFISSFGSGRS